MHPHLRRSVRKSCLSCGCVPPSHKGGARELRPAPDPATHERCHAGAGSSRSVHSRAAVRVSLLTDATRSSAALVPGRFADALDQHLVFNYADVPAWPLVLGVFGRPGDGKTFQIRTHLDRRGVRQVSINAADLESDRAGAPGKLVLEMYENAGHRIDEGLPTAVVVDDFDTTVGDWEHSTTTVNHQQVLAQLMHLADNPTEAGGKRLRRVPVFITGNDLSKIYPPLRRPGRMRAFPWLPTHAERLAIVTGILTGVMKPTDVPDLLTKLCDQPIAFFSDLVVEIIAQGAVAEVRSQAQEIASLIKPGSHARQVLEDCLKKQQMTAADVGALALSMSRARAVATESHIRD